MPKKYIQDLLAKVGMEDAKSLTTPMITNNHLSKFDGDPITDQQRYRSIVRALQYATVMRPDIAFAVNKVS